MNAYAETVLEPAIARRSRAGALPRLLQGIEHEPLPLSAHLDIHGGLPHARGRAGWRRRDRDAGLITEVDRAGLLGRGGGAFPLARKLAAVAGGRGRAIVVANGTEGEPASLKDRTLLELLPHLVLDGATVAAEIVGAEEAIVAVCELAPDAVRAVADAIAERDAAGLSGTRGGLALTLRTLPPHFVAGHESALVNYLSGGPALPTFTPPRPSEKGVARRPTLVSNVETLAHLALIARHGSDWFRELGAPAHAGSALVTLSGAVPDPGVYEIDLGSSLQSLLAAGGSSGSDVGAALIGGYGGAFVAGSRLRDVALSDEHLAAHGAKLGAGVVALLSADACPVAETARLARWLADQSTRQCGPCEHGLESLAQALEHVASGSGRGADLPRLMALARGRGACAHPDGTVAMVASALEVFAPEFRAHAQGGPCERCGAPPELPLPRRRVDRTPARRRGARA
jgi:NADH:ubiquinone oxidoreductase subunit F (NADH-binding)